MNEIPINQTWYNVVLDTKFQPEIFENASSIEMKFKSPDGDVIVVAAARVGATSEIEYELELEKTVLNKLGQWAVWPYITANDGRVAAPRRAVAIMVIPEGSV